ncbi:hypothetical protein X772_24890 [Mesorhizobium sp. LSJC280B00]|nr:hypothetical protein X772_24890 [Mesorhizobium sp. LSJC280B00]
MLIGFGSPPIGGPSKPCNHASARSLSRRWQSGSTTDVRGRISKAGDSDVRRALCEAVSGLVIRFKGRDKVKSWGEATAKRSCHRRASVAVVPQVGGDHHRL